MHSNYNDSITFERMNFLQALVNAVHKIGQFEDYDPVNCKPVIISLINPDTKNRLLLSRLTGYCGMVPGGLYGKLQIYAVPTKTEH